MAGRKEFLKGAEYFCEYVLDEIKDYFRDHLEMVWEKNEWEIVDAIDLMFSDFVDEGTCTLDEFDDVLIPAWQKLLYKNGYEAGIDLWQDCRDAAREYEEYQLTREDAYRDCWA